MTQLKTQKRFARHIKMADNVKISIFGDICPTPDTLSLFKNGDIEGMFNDILSLLEDSDLIVGNLECVLTDNPRPVKKAGPVLNAPTNCITLLKKANFDLLSLANNHIRDCGDEGVQSTIDTCHKEGIKTIGAGKGLEASRNAGIFDIKGIKIGIISFAEREFNVADGDKWGSNCFDPYIDLERIKRLKDDVDFLIVLYHGGIEYFPYPSPELRKKCQAMVRSGADLVTCQHSHCVGTIEEYHGSAIVFGQGNSIFGYRKNDNSWNTGLLLQLKIENTGQFTFTPISIGMTDSGLTYGNQAVMDTILRQRSYDLSNPEFLRDEWMKFCKKLAPIDIPLLLGWPRILIGLNRRICNKIVKLLLSRHRTNITHNMLRCDSHREVLDSLMSEKDYE